MIIGLLFFYLLYYFMYMLFLNEKDYKIPEELLHNYYPSSDMKKLDKVNRVEVIDKNGRQFTRHDIKDVRVDYQDGGKTMKVFVDWKEEEKPKARIKVKREVYLDRTAKFISEFYKRRDRNSNK